jgi:transcriptional regulator with XRE-family HTH domain
MTLGTVSNEAAMMKIKTKVFDLAEGRFTNLTELAKTMGISVSQIYRVREGKRSINEKFIIGAKRAFLDLTLDDLFYLGADTAPQRRPRKRRESAVN